MILSIIVITNLFMALKSIFYRKTYRAKTKKYNSSYNPFAAIFIPCKGIEKGMKQYLQAMLKQDYHNYRAYFIVEKEEDPAVEIIKEIIKDDTQTELVIAGKASQCCQKNHNLLAAIEKEEQNTQKSEIYVFADADVKPSPSWLYDLVLPMSDSAISATTAYRWLKPKEFSFWGTMHAMLSAYLGTLMSSSKGMWGGSMAIKKEVFERYRVKECWSRALGDDIPLMSIITKNNLKRIFVPICTAESENVINERKALYEWFVRQNQYLKVYCFPLWITACILTFINSLTVILTPFFIATALFIPSLTPYVIPLAVYMLLMLGIMSLSRFEGNKGQSFFTWILMAYPAMIMGIVTLIASGGRKDMLWRGIRYGINKDGTVSYVKREVEDG